MITTADFRNGLVVVLDNELMEIVDFQHVKPGKGGAFVRAKFKNTLTGRVLERTFRSGERMEEAEIEEQTWQYLYHDGDFYHVMHPETYEQAVIGEDVVGDSKYWMKENNTINLFFYKGKVIKVKVPIAVELQVVQCEPGIQGDRATGGTKPATLETGATIQVPLFIGEGEVLKVDTRTGSYIARVK